MAVAAVAKRPASAATGGHRTDDATTERRPAIEGDPAVTRDATRLELWVREATMDDVLSGQAGAIERARALQDDGAVDALEVNVWGRRASLSTARDLGGTAARIADRIGEFERWAVTNGRDLRPGFERRERSSFLEAEPRESVVLPTVCLAVYEGDRLREVFPNHDGSGVHTVIEGLAALGTDRVDPGTASIGGESDRDHGAR